MWQDKTFVDTTLVIENREIGVHRCVLSAVSPYFRSMFAGSLRESFQHERIELKEVDGLIVSQLIDYCYTSRISISQERLSKRTFVYYITMIEIPNLSLTDISKVTND